MSMLRQSTLDQLKRINGEIKAQGGTTDRRSDSEKNFANSIWTHDPIGADTSGKRKVATYDQMFSIDIPDADTKVKMKNESRIPKEPIRNIKYNKTILKQSEIDKKLNDLIDEIKEIGVVDVQTWMELGFTRLVICVDDKEKINEIEKVFSEEEIVDVIEYEKWFEENGIKMDDRYYYIVADKSYNVDWYNEKTKMKKYMKLNEGKIKRAIEDAIEGWYNGDGEATQTLSELTGLDTEEINDILNNSTIEDAMGDLMNYETKNETKILNFENFEKMFENSTLNEDKMMDFLSDNFKKLTKEIQKNREDIQHVVVELNNIVKINRLKR